MPTKSTRTPGRIRSRNRGSAADGSALWLLRVFEVDAVAFVFAERFEDVGIGHQRMRDLDRNRLRVDFWIGERDLHVHVSEVDATEPLGDAKVFAVRVPDDVQRNPVVETRGLDDEHVALPAASRVAEICREVDFLWQRTAVGVDLPEHV